MASIVENISGDKAIELGNEDFVRKMSIGSNWRWLRIGLRLAMADTGANITNASFVVGVNQGTDYSFRSSSCIDFVGFSWPWNFDAGTANRTATYYEAVYFDSIRKVGSTITTVRCVNASTLAISNAPSSTRSTFMLDIITGVTNWGVSLWVPTAIADVSWDTFMNQVQRESPPSLSHVDMVLVAHGSSHALDSICLRWAKTSPALFYISDICAVRFY